MSRIVFHRLYLTLFLSMFLPFYPTNASITEDQDVTYITSPIEMKSPGYPRGYDNDLDLKSVIANPSGCITIVFLELSLENSVNPMIRCVNDYLEIVEVDVKRRSRYCGEILPENPYVSKTHTLNLTFHTDSNVTLRGYSTQLFFQQCFKYRWTKEKWSECSTTCGEGVMTRRPLCQSSSKMIVGPQNCNISKLPKFRKSCNLSPCPVSDDASQPRKKTPVKRSGKDEVRMKSEDHEVDSDHDEPSSLFGMFVSAVALLVIFCATIFHFGFLDNNPTIQNVTEDADGTREIPGNNPVIENFPEDADGTSEIPGNNGQPDEDERDRHKKDY